MRKMSPHDRQDDDLDQGKLKRIWRDDDFLTTEQAADFLGPSPRTLERYRQEGTGPQFSKEGRLVFYRFGDLKAWRSSQTFTSTAEAKRKKMAHSAAALQAPGSPPRRKVRPPH